MHLDVAGVHRNSRYWPCKLSLISSRYHDLDGFVLARWPPNYDTDSNTKAAIDSGTSNKEGLFTPQKGAYLPFSEGARVCPGKRFSPVEIIAVISLIFRNWSVELDVGKRASNEEVEDMGGEGRKEVYEKVVETVRRLIRGSKSTVTLQMMKLVPLRFVKRGSERFRECFVHTG